MAENLADDLGRLIEELSLIRNALTLLCYYTGKTLMSDEPTLTEVKELIKCI